MQACATALSAQGSLPVRMSIIAGALAPSRSACHGCTTRVISENCNGKLIRPSSFQLSSRSLSSSTSSSFLSPFMFVQQIRLNRSISRLASISLPRSSANADQNSVHSLSEASGTSTTGNQIQLADSEGLGLLTDGDSGEPEAAPIYQHLLQTAFLTGITCLLFAFALSLIVPGRKGRSVESTRVGFVQSLVAGNRSRKGNSGGLLEEDLGPSVLVSGTQCISTDLPSLSVGTETSEPQNSAPQRRRSHRSLQNSPLAFVSAKASKSTSEPARFKVNEKELKEWMRGLEEEARQRGVSEKVIKKALKGVKPLPEVIERDRNQPEFKLTLKDYLERMVTDYRIKLGKDSMQKHGPLLQQVSAKYGVPEAVIVAIWGMESSYGNFMGSWDVVPSLVTLAFDKEQPARAKYFREELINSMFILQDGHASFDTMRGSWAGAMGQCQFMPSSFRNYAVDFDGDGKADIWTSLPDVFASIANYLEKHGWKAGEPYFEEVVVPDKIEPELLGLTVRKPVSEWRDEYGVQPLSEPSTLSPECLASLVTVDGPSGPFYLASQNVSVVLRYNKALFYALAVGHIARSL